LTGWAIRAALATGWWAPLIVLGAAGAAVVGVMKLGTWVWGLPRQARHRRRARARSRARARALARAPQHEAQREFIEMLEREWKQQQ
jgi:hypothetical protein